MAARRISRGSGRNYPRGSAPAGTPTASLAGTPNAPRRDDSLGDHDSPTAAKSPKGAALALLSRRDYTTSELTTRLLDRGYDAERVEDTLRELASAGLVDDARVAAAHTRTAVQVKGRGRIRVARELAARGLSRDAVDRALEGIEAVDEDAAIRKLLKRKRYPASPTLKERQRMFQHLLRRGFRSDQIRRVLGRPDSDDIA